MAAIRQLDLNLLATFAAVHGERSVSAAAVRLGLSQPATSAALARLRAQFGDPLFVRTGGGMVPTPLADRIAPSVHEVLETVRRRILEPSVVDPSRAERTLRLSVSDASGLALLPRIVAHLQQAAPRWRIETDSLAPARLPRALESGEIDLAMGNLHTLASGFYRQRLIATAYNVIHRRDHPHLAGGMSLRAYLEAGHAVMRLPGGLPSVLEQHLAAQGHARRIAVTVPQFLLLPALVAESDLVATVPAHVARSFAGPFRLAVWPLPFLMPELVLHQYWHQRYNGDAGNRWIRRTIRRLFRGDSAV